MGEPKKPEILLAVNVNTRGIAYAVFQGATTPIDWGVRQAKVGQLRRCERHVESLIEHYRPSSIVLQKLDPVRSRRQALTLVSILVKLGQLKGQSVHQIHWSEVRDVFSQFGPVSKFGITRTIATWLPEFESQLPSYRLPWKSEDYSMSIFEALALALTHYYRTE